MKCQGNHLNRIKLLLTVLCMALLWTLTSFADNDSDKPGVTLSNYKEIPIWVETGILTVTDQEAMGKPKTR